jgi:hypothetical protein
MLAETDNPLHAEFYAVQQALFWAQDPNGFASPYKMLMGTLEGSADYRPSLNPAPSEYIFGAQRET